MILPVGGVPANPITRFAPSITGWLHLGHLAHAVFVWGIARAVGAEVIVRLEDHDTGRFRPEYEAAILDDLAWLGLFDEAGRPRVYRQSDDWGVYEAAVGRLRDAYACDCSRKDLTAANDGARELPYGGRCRGRDLALGPGKRLRVPLGPGPEAFSDLLLGHQRQIPAEQCGDLMVRGANGDWAYHLAVVVDDDRQGVNLVIRGEDLLSSTGRQIRLGTLLGRATPPVFAHHPLVLDDGGAKLSKRDGALGIRNLRMEGQSAEQLLGLAAARVGLMDRPEALSPSELGGLFEVS
jgi:glutamyl-tRNA synthetase/glutamyl-Q tRNA(Asp) synthetase